MDEPDELMYTDFLVVRNDKEILWQQFAKFCKVWVRGMAGDSIEFSEHFGKEGGNFIRQHVLFDVLSAVSVDTAEDGDIH